MAQRIRRNFGAFLVIAFASLLPHSVGCNTAEGPEGGVEAPAPVEDEGSQPPAGDTKQNGSGTKES